MGGYRGPLVPMQGVLGTWSWAGSLGVLGRDSPSPLYLGNLLPKQFLAAWQEARAVGQELPALPAAASLLQDGAGSSSVWVQLGCPL